MWINFTFEGMKKMPDSFERLIFNSATNKQSGGEIKSLLFSWTE